MLVMLMMRVTNEHASDADEGEQLSMLVMRVSMIVKKWFKLFISAVHDLPQTTNNISVKTT